MKLWFSDVGTCDMKCERAVWQVRGLVHLGKNVVMGKDTRISVGDNGELFSGENFCITARSTIICRKRVEIGRGVLISWDSRIMDTDFHIIEDKSITVPISIGDHVWLGCCCLVLKGSRIPNGSVLAAGSKVTKNLADYNALYVGTNKKARSHYRVACVG